MIPLYYFFLSLYGFVLQLASFWNKKARLWVEGRKNWESALQQKWKNPAKKPVIWMHCASLGEFEQGRPVLEKLRQQYPENLIVLSFFSPSGFEVRKNDPLANAVIYLPLDSPSNAKKLLDMIEPQLAIFVKYEFWHFYLQELKQRGITTLLISGIFRPTQPFFKSWGSFHRKMLSCFSHMFVQNQTSADLLKTIGFTDDVTIAGDTRFDRVLEAAEQWKPIDLIASFCAGKKVFVAGSTWKADEEIIADWLNTTQNAPQLIIAPHEIKADSILRVKTIFPQSVLFSEAVDNPALLNDKQVLIINNIGYLSRIYKYATICYVGGGFNKSGHHNILEAAVYGKPILTGPQFQKFKESVDLKQTGGSFVIENKEQLANCLQTIDVQQAGEIAAHYVQQNGGATNQILEWIQEKRLFTKA